MKLLKEWNTTPGSWARNLPPPPPHPSPRAASRGGGQSALRRDRHRRECPGATAAARGEGGPGRERRPGAPGGRGRGRTRRGPAETLGDSKLRRSSEGAQPCGGKEAGKDPSRGKRRRYKVCAAEAGRGEPPLRPGAPRAAPRAGRQVPRGSGRRGDFSGQKRGCGLSLPDPPRVPNTRLTNLLDRHFH